jgi:hypothetical protein
MRPPGRTLVIQIPSSNVGDSMASAVVDDAVDHAGTAAEGVANEAGDLSSHGDAMARLGEFVGLHRGVQAMAYRAPGGGGGGGGGAAPATVTKADVLKEMKGGFVDVNQLGAPLKKALADAGIDPSALTKLADKHGRVSPEKLFAFIDGFDANKRADSFAAETVDASGAKVATQAGLLYEALKQEVVANREIAGAAKNAKSFEGWAARHGVLDVNHLGPALSKALGGAVSRADLAAVAGVDGQIKGKQEFAALHALMDRADGRADGIASGKVRLADGSVGETRSAAVLAAIGDDVAANRKLPQYAQPGGAVPTLARLTTAADAMTVDAKDQRPVDLKMKGVDQFALYPGDENKGGKACFEAAVKACADHNKAQQGAVAPKLGGPYDAIQIAHAEDANGRVAIDGTQARLGREYIDKALDAGLPVVVGVSYSDQAYNIDKLTDHFVTIDKRGYDSQNRLYYEYKDPGHGGRVGRLYVDEDTGKLFKQGDHKGPYVHNADFEVTQVRTYDRPI